MHEWEFHMQLYLNILWFWICCTAADKELEILYLHGPQAELTIEYHTQVTDLLLGRDFLPTETNAKLADWTECFDIFGLN